MIRIRTIVGDARVFTIFHAEQWITIATGLEAKTTTSFMEAGQNHLMAGRSLYLKQQEFEHRMKNPPLPPRPDETWTK